MSKATKTGDRYYIYGVFSIEGVDLKKHQSFRTAEHFRDAWERHAGRWVQVQSVAYDLSVWQDGKLAQHLVLPAKDVP